MNSLPVFPVLVAEIAKRKIKKRHLAQAIGVTPKTLYNKLHGTTPFTWDEVVILRSTFFQDLSSDELFAKST